MSWEDFIEKYDTELFLLLSSISAVYILSQWIPEQYYILESAFLILLFGLVQEAWSSIQTNDSKRDFIDFFGASSRTGHQIVLLFLIGSAVWFSLQVRYLVESIFGPLSVIQMIGIIVILSRAYANAFVSNSISAVLDGNADTYAAYFAGAIAFLLSWLIRGEYPVNSSVHVWLSIWPAIIIPYFLFYHLEIEKHLPKLDDRAS